MKYNSEDWNLVEDLIDVLDTYITLGEEDIIDEGILMKLIRYGAYWDSTLIVDD